MQLQEQGPCLVTLRVDGLNYDKARDKYTIKLTDCRLVNEHDNKEAESIVFEVNDASKIVHIEKGNFISEDSGKVLEDEKTADTLETDDFENDKMSNISYTADMGIFKGKDKWFLLFWAVWLICTILIFMVIEGDSFVTAFYFRIVTSFGVGYGDYYPATAGGKMLNCLFIVVDLAKLAYIDWRIISVLFKYKQQKYKHDIMHASSPHPSFGSESDDNVDLSDTVFSKCVNNRHFLIYILVLLGLFFVSGTLVMGIHEGFSWLDAIEWNFVTLSQVGYGNTAPATMGGQLFTIFYIVFGYMLLVALAVIIFDVYMGKLVANGKHSKKGKGDISDRIELTGLLSH